MASDSGGDLQHPRRNLGNRFRSQAEKFVKLSRADPERMKENLNWAEQNARQAILHDFTDERNWNSLGHIKLLLEDKEGMYSVLTDIFTILGRDPENLLQLEEIDMLEFGGELLTATLSADPLDADVWTNLGATLFRQENYGKAATCFVRVIEINPSDLNAHVNLGNCFAKQGKIVDALEVYEKALVLDPENLRVQNYISILKNIHLVH